MIVGQNFDRIKQAHTKTRRLIQNSLTFNNLEENKNPASEYNTGIKINQILYQHNAALLRIKASICQHHYDFTVLNLGPLPFKISRSHENPSGQTLKSCDKTTFDMEGQKYIAHRVWFQEIESSDAGTKQKTDTSQNRKIQAEKWRDRPRHRQFLKAIHIYLIYRLLGDFQVGPIVSKVIGFDAVCYEDRLQFYLESYQDACQVDRNSYEQLIEKLQKTLSQKLNKLHFLGLTHNQITHNICLVVQKKNRATASDKEAQISSQTFDWRFTGFQNCGFIKPGLEAMGREDYRNIKQARAVIDDRQQLKKAIMMTRRKLTRQLQGDSDVQTTPKQVVRCNQDARLSDQQKGWYGTLKLISSLIGTDLPSSKSIIRSLDFYSLNIQLLTHILQYQDPKSSDLTKFILMSSIGFHSKLQQQFSNSLQQGGKNIRRLYQALNRQMHQTARQNSISFYWLCSQNNLGKYPDNLAGTFCQTYNKSLPTVPEFLELMGPVQLANAGRAFSSTVPPSGYNNQAYFIYLECSQNKDLYSGRCTRDNHVCSMRMRVDLQRAVYLRHIKQKQEQESQNKIREERDKEQKDIFPPDFAESQYRRMERCTLDENYSCLLSIIQKSWRILLHSLAEIGKNQQFLIAIGKYTEWCSNEGLVGSPTAYLRASYLMRAARVAMDSGEYLDSIHYAQMAGQFKNSKKYVAAANLQKWLGYLNILTNYQDIELSSRILQNRMAADFQDLMRVRKENQNDGLSQEKNKSNGLVGTVASSEKDLISLLLWCLKIKLGSGMVIQYQRAVSILGIVFRKISGSYKSTNDKDSSSQQKQTASSGKYNFLITKKIRDKVAPLQDNESQSLQIGGWLESLEYLGLQFQLQSLIQQKHKSTNYPNTPRHQQHRSQMMIDEIRHLFLRQAQSREHMLRLQRELQAEMWLREQKYDFSYQQFQLGRGEGYSRRPRSLFQHNEQIRRVSERVEYDIEEQSSELDDRIEDESQYPQGDRMIQKEERVNSSEWKPFLNEKSYREEHFSEGFEDQKVFFATNQVEKRSSFLSLRLTKDLWYSNGSQSKRQLSWIYNDVSRVLLNLVSSKKTHKSNRIFRDLAISALQMHTSLGRMLTRQRSPKKANHSLGDKTGRSQKENERLAEQSKNNEAVFSECELIYYFWYSLRLIDTVPEIFLCALMSLDSQKCKEEKHALMNLLKLRCKFEVFNLLCICEAKHFGTHFRNVKSQWESYLVPLRDSDKFVRRSLSSRFLQKVPHDHLQRQLQALKKIKQCMKFCVRAGMFEMAGNIEKTLQYFQSSYSNRSSSSQGGQQ